MINKAFISVLLALFITPLSAQNTISIDAPSLAQQCQNLVSKIDELMEEQTDELCEIIMWDATFNIENAGRSILNLQYSAASRSLQFAIREFKSTENLSCENPAKISLYINEMSQIDSQISN